MVFLELNFSVCARQLTLLLVFDFDFIEIDDDLFIERVNRNVYSKNNTHRVDFS